MKVIIAGSRTVRDYSRIVQAMDAAACVGIGPTFVLSGKQMSLDVDTATRYGADYLGEQWAAENYLPVIPFPADWRLYGNAAGPRRNTTMVEAADALVAIWDGKSAGTRDVIAKATAKGIPFLVVSP